QLIFENPSGSRAKSCSSLRFQRAVNGDNRLRLYNKQFHRVNQSKLLGKQTVHVAQKKEDRFCINLTGPLYSYG
ncbi:MAG: hypothetical protein KDE54_04990, partial [Caldilineaceae bacterium]|nr:hypothetical protein [Caldilineaceae bacterium]